MFRYKNAGHEEDVLITIGSRAINQIAGIHGAGKLPVLQWAHSMAKLYMKEVHEKGQEGTVSTLHRLQKNVWIINGRSLAEATRTSCTEGGLKEKKCMGQRKGPLPDYRVGPSPIFQSIAVDLFVPIEYQCTTNKGQVGKGWGVMSVCSATSAVHVEFMDTYLTDSFLMALQRFMCTSGVPSRIQSDRGEQLVAASKQLVA